MDMRNGLTTLCKKWTWNPRYVLADDPKKKNVPEKIPYTFNIFDFPDYFV
jgi:hypothetical protein